MELEVFCKVQEMLRYNQKVAVHKNAKADYLLTEKLFCGKCGAMMVDVSGTSHAGDKASLLLLHGAAKKTVRQEAGAPVVDRRACAGICDRPRPK